MPVVIRGGSKTAATSKMELFVITVNGFQPLTAITKCSILDFAAVLDAPLLIQGLSSLQNSVRVQSQKGDVVKNLKPQIYLLLYHVVKLDVVIKNLNMNMYN